MHIRSIAFKNIIRRKGKMGLIVTGLAVGVATLVAILTMMLAFQKSIENKLDTYGFNIVIYPASSNLSLNYGGMAISGIDTYEVKSLTESDLAQIKRIPDAGKIAAVSPKLLQAVDRAGKKALMVGTDFDQEFLIKKWWHLSGKKPSRPDEVIIGSDAAKNLGLKTGDTVRLSDKAFKVSAVLQNTGSQDDNLIFGDLGEVQALYKKGEELSLIEVSAKNSGDIDRVVKDLESVLPKASVSSIKQAVQYKEKAMGSVESFGLIVSMIIIAISGLIVFTTMTSLVSERKWEIGIFRAIGYRQSVVARIVLTEAFVLSLLGGLVGYVVGFGVIYILPTVFKKIELVVHPNVTIIALAVGLSILIGLVSSLLPARKAAKMDPADALKSL